MIEGLGKDTMRAHYLKFHRVICLHPEDAEFGFRDNLLVSNHLRETAENSGDRCQPEPG
ncbi:MAG: hypothetical protein ABFR82_16665 [Nitrospirota bacterium]